ncbi:MAG: hypothetical protein U0791_25265 [Gemmataceae bacterium]
MRSALLDMYTDQVMDNLIRTSQGLPIVQLDYTDITGTVTQSGGGSYGGEQTYETARSAFRAVATKTFTNVLNYSASAKNENQLTITANPVLNNNEVYNAYLEFLDHPERLVSSCDPPPDGAAHIVRIVPKHGHPRRKVYYWVPVEYAADFFRLSLVTTVQRGQPLSTPEFFEPTIAEVVDSTPQNLKDKKQTRFTLVFDKSLPNDTGAMQVTVGDATHRFLLDRYTDPVDNAVIRPGQKTTRLWMVLTQDNLPADTTPAKLKDQILSRKVRIDLDHYRPTLPTTEDLLGSVRRNVNLIRLNQAR